MKRIDSLIPIAIKAISDNDIPDSKSGIVLNEYKGYIDTFGASVVMNGLIPAIVFFETAKGEKNQAAESDPEKERIKKNRNKLMKAILQVVQNESCSQETRNHDSHYKSLYDYVISKTDERVSTKQIRQKIVDAATAIKLGLRTFAFEKTDENE